MLLCRRMRMVVGKPAQNRYIRGKIRARPALNKLGVRAGSRQCAPCSQIGGLYTKQDREKHRVRLSVGAPDQEICVPPAGWMCGDVQFQTEVSGVGLKP